jgi:hypothetical protein
LSGWKFLPGTQASTKQKTKQNEQLTLLDWLSGKNPEKTNKKSTHREGLRSWTGDMGLKKKGIVPTHQNPIEVIIGAGLQGQFTKRWRTIKSQTTLGIWLSDNHREVRRSIANSKDTLWNYPQQSNWMQLFLPWQGFFYKWHHRIVTLFVSGKFRTIISLAIASEQMAEQLDGTDLVLPSQQSSGSGESMGPWHPTNVRCPNVALPWIPPRKALVNSGWEGWNGWNVETRLPGERWSNPCHVLCPSKWNPGPRAKRWLETPAGAGTAGFLWENLWEFMKIYENMGL